jgi:hypothetical protein
MDGVTISSTLCLPELSGRDDNYVEQHWLLCESIWRVKSTTASDAKLVEFQTTLQGRALQWYIQFV